jgi:predicted nucleic acid-binding protein
LIVVDASALLELFLRTPRAEVIEERLLAAGESLHAPALIDLEVLQVLRRYESRRELSAQRAGEILDLLRVFPLERYTHEALAARIWQLRANLTAYDAAYVALAEGLRAPLVTCDAKMVAVSGALVTFELFR